MGIKKIYNYYFVHFTQILINKTGVREVGSVHPPKKVMSCLIP